MSKANIIQEASDEELRRHFIATGSIQGVARCLGIEIKAPHTRKLLNNRLQNLKMDLRKFSRRRRYTDDDVIQAVQNGKCMSDVLKSLGLSTHGTNACTIRQKIETLQISTEHFNIKECMQRNKKTWLEEEVFVENSPIPRSTLNSHVRRLDALGEEVCSECGVGTLYNGKPLRLTIDHINGVSDDNRKQNLRWLCHNCHSQTETYGGKGKRKMLS
jgi:hypothetical protein